MGKGRTPCCEKGRVKKGPWSQDEDLKLISFIQRHGHSNWRSLPKLAGLARCGKSCRLRWVNYLRPDVKRGSLTPDEEETIIRLQSLLGNKWSKIASHLPGRTDNEIKNIWNTHLKKRSTINTKSSHQDNDKVSYEPVSHDCGGQGLAISLSPKGDGATELSSFNCMALETNLVSLWESLLLDASNEGDRFNLNNNNPYGVSHGKQACMVIEGDTSASNQNKDLLVGGDYSWSFGVLDDYESGKINMDTTATAVGCNQEFVSEHISKTSQLEAFDNNIKSYLETMAWPSSPNCYNFSGF